MPTDIIINAGRHESRIAVLDEGRVVELWIERKRHNTIVGNIYKGRVTKVLPGMQSAFVNVGLDRDAFLYVSDVQEEVEIDDEESDELALEEVHQLKVETSIADLLREGQEVMVQVIKDSIAAKGARVTTHITLPGRFLVYMPTIRHVGVSRRIEEDPERERLKSILEILDSGDGGLIARTAGEGREAEDFQADFDYLSALWDRIRHRAEKQSAPSVVHRDLDLVLRTIRDVLSVDVKSVWIDSVEEYERVVEFLDQIQPRLTGRVRLYSRENPIFDEFGIEPEIEKALRPKVWLKSGGYIVINQTEALVSVDVNTGKFVGKSNLEETVFKANIEAAKEIVRQIRLRDLGGIIVVDFIDMEDPDNRDALFREFESEIRKDRSKTRILQISEFGLIEMTRKRVRQSLERSLTQPCPYCAGTGRISSNLTIMLEIWRQLVKLRDIRETQELVIRVNSDIYEAVKSDEDHIFDEIEGLLGTHIAFTPDPALHREQFEIVRA